MRSKECLEKLVDKTGIMNDTCARLDKCIKCKKCQINDEPVETCDDYNLVMTISQDLDRLETLEKFVAIMVDVYRWGINAPFYKLVNQVNPTSNFLKMVIDQELKNIEVLESE